MTDKPKPPQSPPPERKPPPQPPSGPLVIDDRDWPPKPRCRVPKR